MPEVQDIHVSRNGWAVHVYVSGEPYVLRIGLWSLRVYWQKYANVRILCDDIPYGEISDEPLVQFAYDVVRGEGLETVGDDVREFVALSLHGLGEAMEFENAR